METSVLLLSLFWFSSFIYGTQAAVSASCTDNCDIEVIGFNPDVKYIEAGTKATVEFNVTFINNKNGNKVKPATETQTNLDCKMTFAESNTGAGGVATADELEGDPKAIFSDPQACTVHNKNDMKNGMFPLEPKSLYGQCSLTLPIAKCSKANFLCVDCPKPAEASYSADENTENNKKCVYVKPKIFCEAGRKCLVGTDSLKTSMRCTETDSSCVAYRINNSPLVTYGCTTNENICDGLDDCKRCGDEDNCNVTAGTVRVRLSIATILTTFVAAVITCL